MQFGFERRNVRLDSRVYGKLPRSNDNELDLLRHYGNRMPRERRIVLSVRWS